MWGVKLRKHRNLPSLLRFLKERGAVRSQGGYTANNKEVFQARYYVS